MSTLQSPAPMNVRGARNETRNLVEAAARQDLTVDTTHFWDAYYLNGQVRPDVRPLVAKLLEDGVLAIVEPGAAESLILPTAMIGAGR